MQLQRRASDVEDSARAIEKSRDSHSPAPKIVRVSEAKDEGNGSPPPCPPAALLSSHASSTMSTTQVMDTLRVEMNNIALATNTTCRT